MASMRALSRPGARIWRGLARDTRGTEIAETAVVLPMLFMILIAIFWFGQAFRIYGTLTQASRAGARAAVAPVCATCGPAATTPTQNAVAAITSAMQASHLNTAQLLPPASWTPPTLCACGSASPACGTPVQCDGATTLACVQPNVQLSYPTAVAGGMGTCGTSVSMRYQYPFHFRIPLTNLDLGTMQLPGQAQMRAETQ
jgi:Flp pilus assembly protein TadG